MLLRLSVAEMLDKFRATYRTIDIRSAALRQEDRWANVYAVARLTYEEPAATEKRLRKLEAAYGAFRTDSFSIFLGQRSFAEWEEFIKDLSVGRLLIGSEEIRLAEPLGGKLLAERTYLQENYSIIRPFDGYRWPVAQYELNQYSMPPLIADAVVREAANFGYSDAHEPVNFLCELTIGTSSPYGFHFSLSLPAFASINAFDILPKENKARVEVKTHLEMTPLKSIVTFSEGDHSATKCRLNIEDLSQASKGGSFVTAAGSISLPAEVEHDDWAVAQLLYPGLGELHHVSNQVRRLIPPAERNILFEALKLFCREAQLDLLLSRPFGKSLPFKADRFERSVVWLLGMLGFSAITLGEYEYIRAEESKIERGSIDVLAASQQAKKLVIAACTMAAPEDKDFRKLITSGEILAREVFSDTNVRILPLVCTSAPGQPLCWDTGDGFCGVPILDADRLALALRLVKAGREDDVLSFIDNPMFSQLREP